MTHRIGEGGFFTPENLIGQVGQPLKGMAQQVLALAVGVQLHLRVNGHDVFDKVQISKGDSCLQRVDADAAVGTEHVVHMKLPNALLCLFLKAFRIRREVGVLVAKQLVGDLAGEQHPDIGVFMDIFAHQIHADAGPDGGDVVGTQQLHHGFQRLQHILFVADDLRMVAADEACHLPGVFQVNGIDVHADGKGFDGIGTFSGGNGADQRGVQAAGQQEAHLGIGNQTLADTGDEFFPDAPTDGFQIVVVIACHLGDVAIADELPVLIEMSRGEGLHFGIQEQKVFRLAGKDDGALCITGIVQGADADGVPGGNEGIPLRVVEDAGKFRVQHGKHIGAVLFIQRQQNLAVGVAVEGVVR